MESTTMMSFLAQPEGGDLMEVLVLLIIMALSALGSVLKSRKAGGKKAPPKPPKARRRPADMPSDPEREILKRPDRPRDSQPFGLGRSPEIESQPETPPPLVTPARAERRDFKPEKAAALRQAETSPVERVEPVVSPSDEFSLGDLKKAIVLRELLGPPRSLEAYGNPS